MSITKKVQFTVNKTKDIIIDLHYTNDYSKGVFWSYPNTKTNVGPFKDEHIAIHDAKVYSTYGTTDKELLKSGKKPWEHVAAPVVKYPINPVTRLRTKERIDG